MRNILLLILITSSFQNLVAQSTEFKRFVTRGETIENALSKWVVEYNINLVYDPSLELDEKSYIDITSDKPSVVLAEIISGTGLDFIILSTGTYVLIQKKTVIEDYGAFFGYVYDEETGEPLADATIYFADATNSTSTNREGFFSVSPLLSGVYPVIVSSVGYQPISKNIEIADSSGLNIIRLTPKTFTTDPIIVQANAISLGILKWTNQLSLEQSEQANTDLNPSLAPIKNAPGFITDLVSNSLSIYGSNPSTMAVLLDGVRLYNTVRLGDELGMFSPLAIDKIGTSTAAGSITNEGALNGLLNYQHDITDRANGTNFIISVNPNNLNARSELKLKNTSLAISGRTNNSLQNTPWGYDEVYKQWNRFDPLIQNFLMGKEGDIAHYKPQTAQTNQTYNDIHIVASIIPNEFNKTKISGYFGSRFEDAYLLSQKLNLGSIQPDLVYNEETSETINGMLNIEHFRILNASTDLFVKGSYSGSRYMYSYSMIEDNTSNFENINKDLEILKNNLNAEYSDIDDQILSEIEISSQLTRYLPNNSTLLLGLRASRIDHSFNLSDVFYSSLSNISENYRSDLFIEQVFNGKNNFRFQYGIKGSISSLQKIIYIQPQFTISYDTEKTHIGYQTYSLSGGIYRQFIQQFDIANVGPSAIRSFNRIDIPVDKSISAPVSYQLKFDWNIQYSNQSSIKIESYYRQEPRNYSLNYTQLLSSTETNLDNQSDFLEQISTIAYGASVSFNKEFTNPSILFTLSQQTNISTIRYDERFESRRINTGWSEPYSTYGSLKWKLKKPISLQIQTKWIPKRVWAYSRSYYDFLTTHNESSFGDYSLDTPDKDELNAFFSLDIGINTSIPISKTNLMVNLNLKNITNRKNEISNFLIPQRDEDQRIIYNKSSKYLPGFIPFLSLQLDF